MWIRISSLISVKTFPLVKAWSLDIPLSPAVFQVAACQHLRSVKTQHCACGAMEVSLQLPLVEAPSCGATPQKRDLKCCSKFHSHLATIAELWDQPQRLVNLFLSHKWTIFIASFRKVIPCLDTPAVPVQLLAQSQSWPMECSVRPYFLLDFRYLCASQCFNTAIWPKCQNSFKPLWNNSTVCHLPNLLVQTNSHSCIFQPDSGTENCSCLCTCCLTETSNVAIIYLHYLSVISPGWWQKSSSLMGTFAANPNTFLPFDWSSYMSLIGILLLCNTVIIIGEEHENSRLLKILALLSCRQLWFKVLPSSMPQ